MAAVLSQLGNLALAPPADVDAAERYLRRPLDAVADLRRGAHVEIAANVGKCAEVERARGALRAAAQQFEQQRGMLLRLALAEVGAAPPPTDADDGGAEAALMPLVVGAACAGAAAAGRPQLRARASFSR